LEEEGADELADFKYETEDVQENPNILQQGRYHVVVGNPPYITVKDKNLNQLYRDLYNACSGKYALSVPFAQRFFELARVGDAESGLGYGMVGQITANSFMKREFGTRLIETYFGHMVELTEVIDTSGVYIPGHGTPTVILVGKPRSGSRRSETIRTVRSVQGEPAAPENPEMGHVWQAITNQIDDPGSVSSWVSVDDLKRSRYFNEPPWILADGGLEMVEQLNAGGRAVLSSLAARIGVFGMTNADDIMLTTIDSWARRRAETEFGKEVVLGDELRDWERRGDTYSFFPYTADLQLQELPQTSGAHKWLWPGRTVMGRRATFSKGTYFSDGRQWYEWHQTTPSPGGHTWTISFASVTTHNHFVLDRENRAFKQSAPVIKLREEASEEQHLQLLGLLNSSAACFWLKMVSHDKGIRGEGGGFTSDAWERFYDFTGTKSQQFPIPSSYPTPSSECLDTLAQKVGLTTPSAVVTKTTPTTRNLIDARTTWLSTRARMIAVQEELDWQVYSLYNLHPEDLRVSEDPNSPDIPELALGERAFEIVLARRVAAGEASDEWFKRHGSTPITEIPEHWPAAYREIAQKRIDAIESNRAIGMIERPEYKRRWATEGWDALQEKALKSWLLDRIEKREHWFDENDMPALVTLSRLTDVLSRDDDFVSVAKIYAPHKELPTVVAELMTDEHVPFLAALRYKPSGLKKRADWEHVWDLQRQEDAAPDEPTKRKIRDSIPVPPKYTSADFLRASFWRARGKLDVPKEPFISYGQSNVATPDLYGWAGWDHREQAYALDAYIASHEALTSEELRPFLAGLLELQPWLDQWHDEFDAAFGASPAAFFRGDRLMVQGEHGLTDDDLREWRPVPVKRGARKK
jgi:hypothetical protein